MKAILSQDEFRLSDHIKPGSFVTWGQGSGEPLGLVEKLMDERREVGRVSAFVGLSISGKLRPEHADFVTPYSFGALGTTSRLEKAGILNLIPCNYSSICGNIRNRRIRVDTVFVQLSPAGPDGSHSLGFCNDFLPAAIGVANLVIGEINPNVPWTNADHRLDENQIDIITQTDYPLVEISAKEASDAQSLIGANVADLVRENSTLQYGIGALPGAILKALSGHRNLGLHTGVIGEEVIDLIQSGAINNSRKAIDTGISVGAFCVGNNRLGNFLHCNDAFAIHRATSTHSSKNLAQLDNLVAINSALEVDLFGQVNTEQIDSRYIGAIGGQVDFMHAATINENGLSIIAMSAISPNGQSRIVAKLSGPCVTTSRGDVEVVVTEFGIADLRGRTLRERGLLISDIAAPQFREQLRSDFLAEHV